MPFAAFAESPHADSGVGGLVCLLFAIVVTVLVLCRGRRRPGARHAHQPAPPVAETEKAPPADWEREKDEKIRQVLAARAGKEPATVLAQIEKIEDEYRRKK